MKSISWKTNYRGKLMMHKNIYIKNLADVKLIDSRFGELLTEVVGRLNEFIEMPILDVLVSGSFARGEFVPQQSDLDLIVLTRTEKASPTGFSLNSSLFSSAMAVDILKVDVNIQRKYALAHVNNISELSRVCDSVSIFSGIKYGGFEIDNSTLDF